MKKNQPLQPAFDVWLAPVRLNYWGMTWQEAEVFIKLFRAKTTERIAALEKNVRSTPGFEDWHADFTAESRCRLGPWLLTVGKTTPVDPDDVHVEVFKPGLSPETIACMEMVAKEIVNLELTETTGAMAVDIGIYVGEAVRLEYPSVQWQRCKAKCDDNHNYPLLELTTNWGGNPIRLFCNFAMALLEGRFEAACFERIFGDWMGGAAETEDYRQRKISKKLNAKKKKGKST